MSLQSVAVSVTIRAGVCMNSSACVLLNGIALIVKPSSYVRHISHHFMLELSVFFVSLLAPPAISIVVHFY